MDYTQTIGNTNELKCLTAVMQLGFDCSIPYGNSAKYDFIADINGELLRFQCKSSNFVNDHGVVRTDAFRFATTCQTTNTKETIRHKYDSNQIDYFITCFQDKVYVVPVEECSFSKTLRFAPPNNGCKEWNNANNYLLENYFTYSTQYLKSKEIYLNRDVTSEVKKKESVNLNKCSICGKSISSSAKLCVECAQINSRKAERPSRDLLKELIRNNSFIQIGKDYGVSDNAVRKWCLQYNLPNKVSEIKKLTNTEWDNI